MTCKPLTPQETVENQQKINAALEKAGLPSK